MSQQPQSAHELPLEHLRVVDRQHLPAMGGVDERATEHVDDAVDAPFDHPLLPAGDPVDLGSRGIDDRLGELQTLRVRRVLRQRHADLGGDRGVGRREIGREDDPHLDVGLEPLEQRDGLSVEGFPTRVLRKRGVTSSVVRRLGPAGGAGRSWLDRRRRAAAGDDEHEENVRSKGGSHTTDSCHQAPPESAARKPVRAFQNTFIGPVLVQNVGADSGPFALEDNVCQFAPS